MNAARLPEAVEMDSAPAGLMCCRQTALPAQSAALHMHVEVNFIKKGSVTYLHEGKEIRAGIGRLVTFWAAIPHQIAGASEDAEYYVLTVPLSWFLQCRFPESFTQPLLNGQILVSPRAEQPLDINAFERWIADLRQQERARHRMVLLEVEARLRRLALSVAAHYPVREFGRGASTTCDHISLDRIRQMLCFIAQRYTDQITVELISKSAGFQPGYAMNLFRKTFGTTLVNYVTRHRVSHAQRLLATSDQKVVDVAMSSGFNSLSRFNDAFKKACGCSPREYRERYRHLGVHRGLAPATC